MSKSNEASKSGAQAATRMGRPAVPASYKRRALSVYLRPATIKRLREVAEIKGDLPGRLAARIIESYLDDPTNCR